MIAADLGKFNLHGREMYVYEQAGVIYYVGITEPATEDLEVISQWLKLPVVHFLYDGPAQYRDSLEEKLNELGVLFGIGDVLHVSIKTSHELAHYEVSYKDIRKSDTTDISRLIDHLTKIFVELFPPVEKPKTGFLVEIGDQIDVKKVSTNKPVEFRYKEKAYSVTVRGRKLLLSEGFYEFFGKTIYVDRDMDIDEPVFFVEGAEMVYKVKDNFAIYKAGRLSFPDGRSFYVEEPFDIVNETILKKLITVKVDNTPITTPIIGRYDQYLLFANGMIAPIDLSWTMKICGPIVDWAVNKDRLYVLDVFCYVKAIDLKNRKTLWEKRLLGAWGIGSNKDLIYVGSNNQLIALNENGQVVSNQDCYDFGAWKEGIITLKSPQDGYVIRSHIGFAVMKGSQAILYIDEPRSFENVIKIKFFDWGAVIVTQTGCWVVER